MTPDSIDATKKRPPLTPPQRSAVEALKNGPDHWDAQRRLSNSVLDFGGEVVSGLDLSKHNMADCQLSNITFSNCNFIGVSFDRSKLHSVSFSTCVMERCSFLSTFFERGFMKEFKLTDAKLHGTTFHTYEFAAGSGLDRPALSGAQFHLCEFMQSCSLGRKLSSIQFTSCKMLGYDFSDTDLSLALFGNSDLTGAIFIRANLRGTNFGNGTNLSGADLTGCQVDKDTQLKHCVFLGTTIERYTLERLNDEGEHHCPIRGDRLDMNIVDPVQQMRMDFSGLMGVVHWVALLIFLSPYLVFVCRLYLQAGFSSDRAGTATVIYALWEYGISAGRLTGFSWISLISFILIAYNIFRLVLLWKTKRLEFKQVCSGLPAKFTLASKWGMMLRAFHVLFYFNILMLIVHTVHFLTMRVSWPLSI